SVRSGTCFTRKACRSSSKTPRWYLGSGTNWGDRSMNRLLRLWDMSPREVTHAIQRRVNSRASTGPPKPAWRRVAAGPLAGAELYVATDAVDTWRDMVAGTHDGFLFDAVSRFHALEGRVCWDIGAHFGYHTLSFAALVGNLGRVIAFEPNPANLARM